MKHLAAGQFFVSFWKKMDILMPFESHFASFQSYLKEKKILRLESQLNKSLPLLQVKSNTLKILHSGVNFVTWSNQGIKVHRFLQHF